jgi:hypothetical protein
MRPRCRTVLASAAESARDSHCLWSPASAMFSSAVVKRDDKRSHRKRVVFFWDEVGNLRPEGITIMGSGENLAGVWAPARRVEADPGIADRVSPELDA